MALFCDRCRFKLHKGKYFKSRHTGRHYCFPLADCERKMRGELTLEESAELAGRLEHQLATEGWAK